MESRTLTLGLRVDHVNHDLELLIISIALSSRLEVIHVIHTLELFIAFSALDS